MFIVLPNENQNLETVIDRLDSRTINNEIWHLDEVEVHIVLPKFKFDSSLNLNEVVQKVCKWIEVIREAKLNYIFVTLAWNPRYFRDNSNVSSFSSRWSF